MIRVLVVDDKELTRASLRALLRRAPDIECVGEACDGRQALELAEQLLPDLVLMDIKMPVMDGLVTTAELSKRPQKAFVLIVSMSYNEQLVRQAMKNGARGYVAKLDMFEEIVDAVRAVHAGKTYFSEHITPIIHPNESP